MGVPSATNWTGTLPELRDSVCLMVRFLGFRGQAGAANDLRGSIALCMAIDFRQFMIAAIPGRVGDDRSF
jgi:hypothetical protein